MSTLMEKTLPVLIVSATAMVGLLDFFFPEFVVFKNIVDNLTNVGTTVFSFTVFVVSINFILLFGRRFTKRTKGEWYFALYALLLFVAYTILGVLPPIMKSAGFMLVYDNMYMPINQTMSSVHAFSIIGGAIRAFRARTWEAAILMVSCLFVFMQSAPIGAVIHPLLPSIGTWIIDVPNLAANRGLLICVAIGTLALGVRQMVGMERSYLGATEE